MRRHLELGLTLAAFTLALGGAGCSRQTDRSIEAPRSTAEPVPVSYTQAHETSTGTPNASTGTTSAGVGYDSKATGAASTAPTSSTMDNGGYDQSGVPSSGATDNVPSGGGPADLGNKGYKPGSSNDDNTDDSLAPDKGKDKSNDVKPEGGTPKPNKPKSKK